MLANFHTHTVFCDGKNTPEQIVQYAIDNGFDAIGFSGHGFTEFDVRYCMKDTDAYISSVNILKSKYKNKIQIYLGIEEDMYSLTQRGLFDYIIGSSHYLFYNGTYYPIDSNAECFKKCLDIFNGDILKLAQNYYEAFCSYIKTRKPDIAGHFDLITKFDESEHLGILQNKGYIEIAGKYMLEALKTDVIFEVNTGAIARGLRTSPYPCEQLLHIIKKQNGKIILSSDSHSAETLNCSFNETKAFLKQIGFQYVYVLFDNEFRKDFIE